MRRAAVLEAALATAAGVVLVRIQLAAGGFAASLAPAVWIYVPLAFLLVRCRSLALHGFSLKLWTRGWRGLAIAAVGILGPLAAALLAYAAFTCEAPREPSASRLDAVDAVWMLLWVAIPEELFFRGYVQARLDGTPSRAARGRSLPVAAIVLTSLLFAATHVAVEPGPWRAAVFFPGLVLGYLRASTRSLLAPAGFHWLANLLWMGAEL